MNLRGMNDEPLKSIRMRSVLQGMIYVLLGTTFLNNAFFAIHLGFFSLFPYRMMLMLVGFLIVFQLIRTDFRTELWAEWRQMKVKGCLWFFIFWLNYAVLSLLWAKSVPDGIKYIAILVMGIFLLFVVTLFLNDIRKLTSFYYIWVFMSLPLLIIGYWNYFTGRHFPGSTLFEGPENKIHFPTAVFHNQNDFATFLSITLFFFLSLLKNGKTIYWKALGAILTICTLHLIIISESRASLLGVVIGFIVYLYILSNRFIKRWIVILGSASMVLFIILFHSKIWETFSTLFLSPTVRDFSKRLPSNEGRANLIRNALHFSLDSFGMGVGAGNAEHYMKNYPIHDTDGVVNVHFWFLELLTNFGVFVLLGYLFVYVYLMFKLYKYYVRGLSNQYKLLVEALFVALSVFVFSSIGPSSVANLYFHWVFLAFVIATVNILRRYPKQAFINPS